MKKNPWFLFWVSAAVVIAAGALQTAIFCRKSGDC